MMSGENTAEKDSFFHKFFYEEKYVPIKMFCCQVVYLLLNYLVYFVYSQHRSVVLSLGFESVTDYIFSLETTSDFLMNVFFSGFIVLVIYPVISILSFCVFVWAYVTENLQKRKVRFMCNLPPILICIYIILLHLHSLIPRDPELL